MYFNAPVIPWHMITFNTENQTQLKLSMKFTDDLFLAYMNNQHSPTNTSYYYKHNDSESIYYLPPEISSILSDILSQYGATVLIEEPNIIGFEKHTF
nr:hypothetical protein [uncultured Tolumonas sp.]